MKLKYFGHSAFQITSNSGIKVLIDPFLDDNPLSPIKSKDVDAKFIILTHGHGDHVGDGLKIGKRCNSLFICVNELAEWIKSKGLNAHNMHIGGAHNFDFGRVKFTIAHHGSLTPDNQYAGEPSGVLVTIDGKTIYHTGDTGLFYDMKLIGEMNPIDYMLLPIGDNYTMGPEDAAYAAKLLSAKKVVPIHYNTFPIITQDPQKFIQMLEQNTGTILLPGEGINF